MAGWLLRVQQRKMVPSVVSLLSSERQATLRAALEASLKLFPAVAIALVDSSRVLHEDAVGDVDGAPASPTTTAFLSASISKTITAALVVDCAARGELDLDDDVCRFLPEECAVRNPNFPDAAVTPRHLLLHKSGLQDDESALYEGIWRTEGDDCPVTLAEYVHRRLCPASGREHFEPWLWSKNDAPGKSEWHYSNAGFAVLGLVLETVSGFGAGGVDTLAKKRFFEPLGMNRSSFFLSHMHALPVATQLAVPHRFSSSEKNQRIAVGHYGVCEYPAAQLRSTASDMSRWILAHSIDSNKGGVLSERSINELMPKGEKCKGGLAWWGMDAQYGSKAGRTWEHGGFMDGVRSHIYIWPAHHVGAVILTNGEGSYKQLEFEIKAALADHLGVKLSSM